MRGFVAALGIVLVGVSAALAGLAPAEAKETEEFTVGQWTGFVFTDDNTGQFTDCTVWALNNANVYVGITVNKTWNLELYLNSKGWNLPLNQSYRITYWIDRNPVYNGTAETYSATYVKIGVERGQAVFDELRGGNTLTFRTQGGDYIFNLSGSNAALNRLLDCVDQYTKQASTNPFGGGSDNQQSSGSSGDGQSAQPFGEGEPQGGDSQQQSSSSGTDAGAARLKSLTQSMDEVQQFLVEVTGAKPSMISIKAQTFKSGDPKYTFSTPIGAGQFWQEYLGQENLRDVVLDYLAGYKDECDGEFEQSVADVVQGQKGEAVLGVANCSKSSYQDDGAEVMSYAMTTSGGVISIYVTYVGGNAAKARTDSLGKLIARRQESDIK